MILSPLSFTGQSLSTTITPYLGEEEYTYAERYTFSTTLYDQYGKTGLVKVVAYSWSYPQRWILKTEVYNSWIVTQQVLATPELINRFSTWWEITLDERKLTITDRIIESSDIGFSFGTENHLIILPTSLLSGSMLLSSGSRLDHDLLLSFKDEKRVGDIKASLEKNLGWNQFRIRTYEERTNRTLEVVDELSNYILLILLLSSIFALVILRSAHTTFFENLNQTLRISQILGFTQKRQKILFAILYSLILPISIFLSILLTYYILSLIAKYPGAENFGWDMWSFFSSIFVLILLIVASFYPAWKERWYQWDNRKYDILFNEYIVNIFVWIIILLSIFENIITTLVIIVGWGVLLYSISKIFYWIYSRLFHAIQPTRKKYFQWFDAVRTLVRPLTPTIPITLSLVSVTTFLGVFILISSSFYTELTLDLRKSANMFALNVLDKDKEGIQRALPQIELYSILRARISRINNKTLEEHFQNDTPSGEFTREFNITTNILKNRIIQWKSTLLENEVSVDENFAKRLWVTVWDTLEFLLSGKNITLTIANIRQSERQGFTPFFYFSLNPEAFRSAPKTYFASAYVIEKELWKRLILENSWPHVTFVDIESILLIVRDISQKILSVLWLFLGVVWIFAFFAIRSFFSQMKHVETMKRRLYALFGLRQTAITQLLNMSRGTILVVSGATSIILAISIASLITYRSSILSLSFVSIGIMILIICIFYGILILSIRQR
jgi:putative ABC transport system permease protein